MHKCAPFLPHFIYLLSLLFLIIAILKEVWGDSSMWLWFAFFWWLMMLSISTYTIDHVCLRKIYLCPSLVLKSDIFLLFLCRMSSLHILILIIYKILVCKYFRPFYKLPFHFVDLYCLWNISRSFFRHGLEGHTSGVLLLLPPPRPKWAIYLLSINLLIMIKKLMWPEVGNSSQGVEKLY